MMNLLVIAGGVALLLFGVRYLRKGLDRLFGRRLMLWMQRIGNRPGVAFFSGLGISATAPSSTTVSLMAVSAVQSGQMTARQMLMVMLGANIGLTVMVQLVALDLDRFSPVLILVGVILFQYTSRTNTRGLGQIILSLGLIFLAMSVIKQGVPSPIDPDGDLARLIEIAERHPFGLTMLAVILAMMTQSSTAAIGLVIGLIATGAVGLGVAVPAVLGANVGLAVTTLIIGWSQIESRRLGLGNLLLKALVMLIGLALLPLLTSAFEQMPGPTQTKVAMAHTGFNIAVAIIGVPLIGVLSTLLVQLVPEPRGRKAQQFGPRYISNTPPGNITLALGQSMREIMHVSELVRSMLDDLWTALQKNDENLAREVGKRDDQVDQLDSDIKRFLTRSIKEDVDDRETDEQMLQLRYLSELETIGDIIDKNLSELVLKKIRLGASFSDEGQKELDDFFKRVAENLMIADTIFTTRDRSLAEDLVRRKDELNELERKMRDRHFERLNRGLQESHETSAIHLDLLTHLKRINSSAAYVARAVLRSPREEPPTRRLDAAE